uniref:Zinc finger CHC2-type domain-containing protein n=1 Tax=candidate division CPR3 bacterium TaxID=2268181 RepID=A0A7V3N5T3_UNCC3
MLVKFAKILVSKFDVKIEGNEYRMNCPMCGDTKKHFSFNVEKGISNCFRCGYRPNAVVFLVEQFGFSLDEAKDIVSNIGFSKTKTIEESLKIDLPDGFVGIKEMNSVYKDYVLSWLGERGVSEEEAEELRLGVVLNGEGDWKGRLIIPCWEEGKLVYFIGRALFRQEPRYLYPPFPKKGVVWGYDNLKKEDGEVCICEGWLDAHKVSGIAVLGQQMSKMQWEKIREEVRRVGKVSIILDKDALSAAVKMADAILSWGCKEVIEIYELEGCKDPGECLNRDEVREKSMVWKYNNFRERVKLKLKTQGGKNGFRTIEERLRGSSKNDPSNRVLATVKFNELNQDFASKRPV